MDDAVYIVCEANSDGQLHPTSKSTPTLCHSRGGVVRKWMMLFVSSVKRIVMADYNLLCVTVVEA